MNSAVLLYFVFVAVLGAVVWRLYFLRRRVIEALPLPGWGPHTSRRIIFGGVVNAPEKARAAIAQYRRETLFVYTVGLVAMVLMIEGAILGLIAIAVIAAVTKPLDLAEFHA